MVAALLGQPRWRACAIAGYVSIGVSINVAPPELPVYEQPPMPGSANLDARLLGLE